MLTHVKGRIKTTDSEMKEALVKWPVEYTGDRLPGLHSHVCVTLDKSFSSLYLRFLIVKRAQSLNLSRKFLKTSFGSRVMHLE